MTDPDATPDPLSRAAAELGEPDAVYAVGPAQVRRRMLVAGGLLVYGVVANYLWWAVGPARFEHVVLIVLFGPPVTGLSMLRHALRARGLHVLAYPTGLLRVHGGEVEAYPWDRVQEVRVRGAAAELRVERDDGGAVRACWLAVEPPWFKLSDAGVTVVRDDGTAATFGPTLADYGGLAERVQRGTFAARWPGVWERYAAGQALAFGKFEATWAGLRYGATLVPWAAVGEVAVSQKNLTVKRAGKWLPWAVADLGDVPDSHLLVALIAEATRHARPPAAADD